MYKDQKVFPPSVRVSIWSGDVIAIDWVREYIGFGLVGELHTGFERKGKGFESFMVMLGSSCWVRLSLLLLKAHQTCLSFLCQASLESTGSSQTQPQNHQTHNSSYLGQLDTSHWIN